MVNTVRHLAGSRTWCGVSLAVAVLIAYSNTWQVPFLLDDVKRIVEEPAVRDLRMLPELMAKTNRPIAMATFAVNHAVHGYQVWGYHVVNAAIHLAGGLVLFGLLRRTFSQLPATTRARIVLREQSSLIAWAIALLWLVHPLQTQAVTYIVQRLESLMGLAYLSTLYFFVRGVGSKRRWGWFSLSVGACAFGMGCKEVMVTAPLMVLAYDRVFLASSWRSLWSQRWKYYCGLVSTWGVLAWAMLHDTSDYTSGALLSVPGLTPSVYLWNQSAVLVHYLRLAVWPVDQCFFYQWPVVTELGPLLPSTLAIGALGIGTLIAMVRWPQIGFIGFWFFVILAPTSSLVPIRDLAFEHRMYLSLAAVIALLVIIVGVVLDRIVIHTAVRRRVAYLLVFSVAGLSIGATLKRNHDYRSASAIWKQTVEVVPLGWGGWVNYASALVDEKRYELAVEAFAQAVILNPDDVGSRASYAGALIEMENYAEAESQLQLALELKPDDYLTILNFGQMEFARGRLLDAIPYLEGAVEAKPDNTSARVCLAACLIHAGEFVTAERHCREALRQQPESSEAMLNLACALGGQGRTDAAIESCLAAIELDPTSPNAHGTLAVLLADTNIEEAKAHFRIASALESQLPTYDLALANLLIRDAPTAAVEAFQAALHKQADCIEAHLGLVDAYGALGQADAAIPHLEFVIERMPDWVELKRSLKQLRRQVSVSSD